MSTSELREFSFVMHTTCSKTVRFKEVGHVSSSVSCPIISYGKLFKRGWRIGGTNEFPLLEHRDSNISISMAFKNESIVLQDGGGEDCCVVKLCLAHHKPDAHDYFSNSADHNTATQSYLPRCTERTLRKVQFHVSHVSHF